MPFCRAFQASVAHAAQVLSGVAQVLGRVAQLLGLYPPSSCALLLKSSSVLELELSVPLWPSGELPELFLCVS